MTKATPIAKEKPIDHFQVSPSKCKVEETDSNAWLTWNKFPPPIEAKTQKTENTFGSKNMSGGPCYTNDSYGSTGPMYQDLPFYMKTETDPNNFEGRSSFGLKKPSLTKVSSKKSKDVVFKDPSKLAKTITLKPNGSVVVA